MLSIRMLSPFLASALIGSPHIRRGSEGIGAGLGGIGGMSEVELACDFCVESTVFCGNPDFLGDKLIGNPHIGCGSRGIGVGLEIIFVGGTSEDKLAFEISVAAIGTGSASLGWEPESACLTVCCAASRL